MKLKSAQVVSHGTGARGLTLVEVMVSVALASVLLATASSVWLYGSRSFAAMTNYTDLDHKSRNALDQISREIRQASRVTGFDNSGTAKWLAVTNDALGAIVTYSWNADSRKLVRHEVGPSTGSTGPSAMAASSTSRPGEVYLTECDRWDFELYQRAPAKGGGYVFFPATNTVGAYDLSICKLINMTWKCSRTILGSKVNTESVQTAQVVLRNKQ